MSPEPALSDETSVIAQPKPSQSEYSVAPSDPSLSVNSIYEDFKISRGLLTIGCPIKNIDDWDVARERFIALMSALKSTKGSSKRSLAWALDMRRVGGPTSMDQEKLALLKYCLDGLQGNLKAWVAKRASFLIALPDSLSDETEAGDFFRDMAADSRWDQFEVITVLHHAHRSRGLTFSDHGAQAGESFKSMSSDACKNKYPKNPNRKSCYKVIRAIFRIGQSLNSGMADGNKIDELKENRLTFFSFEQFLEFTGDYSAAAA